MDSALTLSAFYSDGLPVFRAIPPSKQREVVAVRLSAGTGHEGGDGRPSAAAGSLPWQAAALEIQRIAFEVLFTHAGVGAAAGGSEITANVTNTCGGSGPGGWGGGRGGAGLRLPMVGTLIGREPSDLPQSEGSSQAVASPLQPQDEQTRVSIPEDADTPAVPHVSAPSAGLPVVQDSGQATLSMPRELPLDEDLFRQMAAGLVAISVGVASINTGGLPSGLVSAARLMRARGTVAPATGGTVGHPEAGQ